LELKFSLKQGFTKKQFWLTYHSKNGKKKLVWSLKVLLKKNNVGKLITKTTTKNLVGPLNVVQSKTYIFKPDLKPNQLKTPQIINFYSP